jgi:ABC-2 type transport system ATP-binding protein
MADPAISVQNLTRSFGSITAVNRLSFDIARGQVCGFIGPNGAGKTTTMRVLATLDVPDDGDVMMGGFSVVESPREARRCLGFMSDHFSAYPHLEVRQYLDFFARAYGLRGRDRVHTVAATMEFCGLSTLATRLATTLSKGMGQRLHLAKTLVHDPSILILDEPTAGLDPHARIEFRELIRELASREKTILISSHILSELGELCGSVIVIERGRRVVAGDLGELAQTTRGAFAIRVEVLGDPETAEKFFLTQPMVSNVTRAEQRISFSFAGDDDALSDVLARTVAAGIRVSEFRKMEADLEDIFLKLTRGQVA